MFISPWFIVLIFLIVAIFGLFMVFVTWLTHSLEGYPTLLIQNGDRDPGAVLHRDPDG